MNPKKPSSTIIWRRKPPRGRRGHTHFSLRAAATFARSAAPFFFCDAATTATTAPAGPAAAATAAG